jgi:DNA-binding CsgD family transcriptional regulator
MADGPEPRQRRARTRAPFLTAARRDVREHVRELAAGLAGSGIRVWWSDPYQALLSPRTHSLKQRRVAARLLAADLPPFGFKKPALRKALAGWPPAERDAWLRQLFAAALVAAGQEAATQGRIRLGRQWVKTLGGRVHDQLAPVDLPLPFACRWLRQRAWRITEALLSSDANPGYRVQLSRRGVVALHVDYNPTRPAPLWSRLSTRERQVYDILLAGGSIADAATRLKVSPKTIHTLKHRLRGKVRRKM